LKPAPFSYPARSVPETVALLAEPGDGAKTLAGGQNLVSMMNFRRARPAALIDVSRIPGLEYLRSGAIAPADPAAEWFLVVRLPLTPAPVHKLATNGGG
jgi:hypothetical protein